MQVSHPSVIPQRPVKRWFAWAALAVVSMLAVASVYASMVLREHADSRRHIMDELGQIETLATAQSSIVWRGLTVSMAGEKLAFVRIRGEEQMGRNEIYRRLENLRQLEEAGLKINTRLGFAHDDELLAALEGTAGSFLGGVQGAFGQMTLSVERIRQRLDFWDMNFGYLQEALQKLKERDETIAKASSRVANQATVLAAFITLFASALFVLRLGMVRARREQELQAERLASTAASEARFRELVQNASDLILVLEPSGQIRYATPSARALQGAVQGHVAAASGDLEAASQQALEASQALEAAIATGVLHASEAPLQAAQGSIQRVLGLSPHEFVANGHSEVALVDAAGETRIFDVQATDLTQHEHIGGIVLNARDITERKILEERLRYQALHDPLTNLPNRRQFKERFDGLSTAAKARSAVLFVDLDGFKLVNDSYGHKAGDQLLVLTASRLGSCLQPLDLLARQGGDEFLILLDGDGVCVADKIQKVLAAPFVLDGREVFVSASIGIVQGVGELDAEGAAQRADIAMYAAKQAGKAQAVAFEETMLQDAPERLQMETDFRRALERGEFTVFYQPKVGLESGRIESLEALVRWIHPTRGFVSPDSFISFAEETGLIADLGRIVLEKACMEAVRWQEKGVVIAVNLSPVQFRNPNLIQEVRNALAASGLDPAFLELEITESAVLGDLDNTVKMLAELKSLGLRLAIDDFGTGYSNLGHIKHFNVDVLKIDQSFVRGGNPSAQDHLSDGPIVEAVIGMARAFGLHVVAEGVETESHARELRALGADLGQGYYFSKPVTGEAIDALLEAESLRFEAAKGA